MSSHKMLKPEELEVGMTAAYPLVLYGSGWSRRIYRHRVWKTYKVKRITPKRTKVVLEYKDGGIKEVNLKEHGVYVPDESMKWETEMAQKYSEYVKLLDRDRIRGWKYADEISDSDLVRAHELLTELDSIMARKESEDGNDGE